MSLPFASTAVSRLLRTGPWCALLTLACVAPPPADEPVAVTVPPGVGMDSIAVLLDDAGIVRSAGAFTRYVSMTGDPPEVEPGTYYLDPKPLALVWRDLRAGPVVVRLEIPEGGMLREVAEVVETALGIPAAEFVEAASNPGRVREVGARGETVDGYLYPTAYYVPRDINAPDLVARMIEEFERRWRSSWSAAVARRGLVRDEVVTLASIVSGETRLDDERGTVASVYRNRLERGMRLQADPTVVYALDERRRLTNADYRIDSPVNTYRIDGIPPHPIAQPSAASIEAVLFPDSTDYLYFVANADGRHVFSATYREHLAAIREIRSRGASTTR